MRAAEQEHQRSRTNDSRDQHEREGAGGQPVEHVPRVRSQYEDVPANAPTPAITAAPTARFRKYATMRSSDNRSASQTRYTDERYAATVTARTPPRIDVG